MNAQPIPWTHWYEEPAELAKLYQWLDDHGQAPDDVVYFLSKPWHWTPEYDQMLGDTDWQR